MPVTQPMRQYAPPGTVAAFAGSDAPAGWLKCAGQAVSRATYGALFAYIGTTYGAGDGSTTFNVPDMRGEFVRGLDDGRGVDAGRAIGSAQGHAIESHSHQVYGQDNNALPNGASSAELANVEPPGSPAAVNQVATGNTGGTETRPRNIALLYCIKT